VKNVIFFFLCWMCAVNAALSDEPQPDLGASPPRAQIVIAENPHATAAFEPDTSVVQDMVDHGIQKLTGQRDIKSAWLTFVSSNDVVGLKVYSGPGPNSGTRPAVVEAVVRGLLKAGIPATNIIVWDKRLVDLRLAGFSYLEDRYNIRLAGSADSGYDAQVSYTNNPIPGNLSAGDLEFDRDHATTGNKSYVSKLLTQTLTKIITISPLLNNNFAGVCGNLYGLAMGSVDNTQRFQDSEDRLLKAVPEIYALAPLSDHVVLSITDALIGQYLGEQMSLLHYSTELNQIWFSKDPVALDVWATHELDRERAAAKMDPVDDNPKLYQNAALLELGVPDLSKIRLDIVH
jgi:hypothetical protein